MAGINLPANISEEKGKSNQSADKENIENRYESDSVNTCGVLNEDKSYFGILVENLSTISTPIDEYNPSKFEKDEDSEYVEQQLELKSVSIEDQLIERSYSVDSDDILAEKYNKVEAYAHEIINLDTLPAELFLHICSFLEAKFVIKILGQVCQRFYTIVNDETFWKVRMGMKWRNKYPAIPVRDEDFSWAEACVQREEQYLMWSSQKENLHYYKYKEGLFAPVDVVHLMKDGQLLAAGSRDRYLSLLDVSKLDPENPDTSVKRCKIYSNMKAHKGWIWAMSSLDNTLLTGSWDTYIKFWDVLPEGKEVMKVKCASAILCTHYEPGYALAGAYDKKVYHIDTRTGSIIARKRYHKKPVLCMAADDKYVVTGSEDQTLVVYDRRADKIIRSHKFDSYVMSLSYGLDQLWLGSKSGSIQLLDATYGNFNIVETYEGIHSGKVTGLQHGLGSTFTCSTDKTIKVLQPGLNPTVITSLEEHTADIAKISFQNDVLASAGSDVSIGIWTPHK